MMMISTVLETLVAWLGGGAGGSGVRFGLAPPLMETDRWVRSVIGSPAAWNMLSSEPAWEWEEEAAGG
jgi:hypothetical protein